MKKPLRVLGLFSVLFLLASCQSVRIFPDRMTDPLVYHQFTVAKPRDSSWFIRPQEQAPTLCSFGILTDSRTHTAYAAAQLFKLDTKAGSLEEFEADIRQRGSAIINKQRLSLLSLETKAEMRDGQYFVSYSRTVADKGAVNGGGNTLLIKDFGYYWKHPGFDNVVLYVVFSERGLENEIWGPGHEEAQYFIDHVKITPRKDGR